MDKRKEFGYNHWFLKDAIYKMLIEEGNKYFGIEDIKLNKGRTLSQEEIDIRYKLCNLISMHIEGVINRTDIMAVLYKIDFIIIKGGRLDISIHYKEAIEDINTIAFEESIKLAKEEGYNI